MFWQISKIILRMWRNRIYHLIQRYPLLLVFFIVLPVVYIGGAYLFYAATYRALSVIPMESQNISQPDQLILFSVFNSFSLVSFLLMIISIIFSPNETTVSRIFAPLPINPSQLHTGIILPGLSLFYVAQIALWLPVFVAIMQTLNISIWQMCLAILLGLIFHSVFASYLYQLTHYLTIRVFGSERIGLRSIAIPLSIVFGVSIIALLGLLGVRLLAQSISSTWLWIIPAFWMSSVAGSNLINVILGICILTVLSIGLVRLYILLLDNLAKLVDGTKGGWVPFRGITFGRDTWQASCAYELKVIGRDQQTIVGIFLVIAMVSVLSIAILWLRLSNSLFPVEIVVQITGYLSTVALCTVAYKSWGRERENQSILAITPLSFKTFINGKIFANMVSVSIIWLLITLVLSLLSNNFFLFVEFRLLILGTIISFFIGTLLPWSTKDPLSTIVSLSLFMMFGIPLQLIIQDLISRIDVSFSPLEGSIFAWSIYILLTFICYLCVVWIDTVKRRERHG